MKSTYDSLEDIIIFDNLISPSYQDWLLDMVDSEHFLWTRDDNSVSYNIDDLDDKRNGFADICLLFKGQMDLTSFRFSSRHFYDESKYYEKVLNYVLPLIFEFIEPLNVNLMSRVKIKATPAIGTNQIQLPHMDQVKPNSWNIIYYFNDTDGDTVIYNERAKSADQRDFLLSKDVWTVKQRVSPKKGRAVAFKSDLFHSASCSKNKPRFILNINLSEKVSQNFIKYN